MKKTLIISLAAAIVLFCSPLVLLKDEVPGAKTAVFNTVFNEPFKKPDKESFKIKTEKGIEKVSTKDYIIGVLAGEISPLYEPEAIKAQAVAAYTFALRRAAYAKEKSLDYDLTNDPSIDQCYINKVDAAKKWGDKNKEYRKIFEDAVDAVYGVWVCYEEKPALTAYHAVSPGKTNSSKDVWGGALPYLVSVDSVGDKLSKNYLSETDISAEDLKEKLKSFCDIDTEKNSIEDIKKADSGLVLSLSAGGKNISGSDLKKALQLKSAAFDVTFDNGVYHFTVYGIGHGVGMSQTGAEYMAKQGSSYEEILAHYYKGTTIKKP